ncbi:MAG: hydroxymethylbilane synthase, partial [Eubacteriales bacterium]|nr:hydroxymethylbilane synthase [Eubacteriales bacterium]
MKKKIVIGSRESRLAVVQAQTLADYINGHCSGYEAVLVTMKTSGDRILDRRLDQAGGKGLFVKELEAALFERRVDLCVHSLKDVPMEEKEELPLIGFTKREDVRDVLVLPEGKTKPDRHLPIGSSSPRRIMQLRNLYPHMRTETVRGNVLTRLQKLDEGEYAALVLAAAGLN